MASITRSGTRRGEPVTMRLTKGELRLLLRGVGLLAKYIPVSTQHDRLIAEIELFFHNEASSGPASTPATDSPEDVTK